MATGTATAQDLRKQFEQAGFTVTDSSAAPGALEVRKANFVSYLTPGPRGWLRFGPPYYVTHDRNCELEDRGYQKFWYSKADGQRYPIRKVELMDLHRFDDEVRYIIGQVDLYNESLGSTNARTVYDRLTGRPDQ